MCLKFYTNWHRKHQKCGVKSVLITGFTRKMFGNFIKSSTLIKTFSWNYHMYILQYTVQSAHFTNTSWRHRPQRSVCAYDHLQAERSSGGVPTAIQCLSPYPHPPSPVPLLSLLGNDCAPLKPATSHLPELSAAPTGGAETLLISMQ